MVEAGGPPFKGLETEWEGVLPGSQALALVDHGIVLGEHVPGLVVGHPEISVRRGLDIFWSVVVAAIVLRLHIRDFHRLHKGSRVH